MYFLGSVRDLLFVEQVAYAGATAYQCGERFAYAGERVRLVQVPICFGQEPARAIRIPQRGPHRRLISERLPPEIESPIGLVDIRLECVVQRVSGLVRSHVPGGGSLEHLDVRFAAEAVRHDAKEEHSRRWAVDSVEMNRDLVLDSGEASLA